MEIGFIGQPYRDSQAALTFLSAALEDPAVTRCQVITAWVRESGLLLLENDLRSFRERGGAIDFLVGVDLKGTTEQGLKLARTLGTSVRVVHDPSGRTFHPKVYLVTGPESGYVLLGSNNLTAGGMFFNYEAACAVTFGPGERPDLVQGIERLAARLVEDKAICKRLTPAVFKRLIEEKLVGDEERDRRHRAEDRAASRNSGGGGREPLFGKSRFEKRSRPPLPRGSRRRQKRSAAGTSGTRRRVQATHGLDSWWKKLGPGDAQRPPVGHPTAVVRLTAPRDAPDRPRFFRHSFFKDEQWRRRRDAHGNWLQVATISVDASIDGLDLGERQIEIDYGPFRNVRGRATTVLHWGSLRKDLLEHDVTGYYLLLERGPDSYSLSLVSAEPK